ncbi:hypothetical protein BDW60DRAFT_200777 [Aspergillus nidulans var. acristatus]
MPPSGDTHDHLPYLSQPGQIFKIYNFLNTCTPDCLGGISSQILSDTCLERKQAQELLMNIALDKKLQDKLWVALDEGSEIFMVAEKNLYYEIELKDEPLPRDVQWKYKDLEVILLDSLDEKYREQGGWVNRPPVRGERPLILIPKLGGNFNDAIFLNYDPSVQDARN